MFKIKVEEETNPNKIIDKRYKLAVKVIVATAIIAVATGIIAAVVISQISKILKTLYFIYVFNMRLN